MRKNLLALAVLAAAFLAQPGCKHPKYALYTSIYRDFQCNVPWAWNVMTDHEEMIYTHTNFLGPFEPDFYLGAPSFSVRWFTRYSPHRLRDDRLEMYSDADDFVKQILSAVYISRRMVVPVKDIKIAGRSAKHFVVLSAGPVHPGAKWGTAVDGMTGEAINPRQHAYVVVSMPRGIYVLTYPATQTGYKKYELQFNQLVNSFVPLKDGPGGASVPPPTDKIFAK